jgi:hypothetical protein
VILYTGSIGCSVCSAGLSDVRYLQRVESGNSEHEVILGTQINLIEAESANSRPRRLLLAVVSTLVFALGLFAVLLTVNAWRLVTRDQTQTDEVIWARAVAMGTGAISAVALLGASCYAFFELSLPRKGS